VIRMIRASSISEAARAARTPSASSSRRKSSRKSQRDARSYPQGDQHRIIASSVTQGMTFTAADFPPAPLTAGANVNSDKKQRSCSETGSSKRRQKRANAAESIARAFEWGQALLDLTSTAPGLAWPPRESPDQSLCLEKAGQKEPVFKRVPLDTPAPVEEHQMTNGDRTAEEGRSPTTPVQDTAPAQEAQLVSEEEGSPAKPQRSPDKRRHDDWINHRSQSVPCSRRNAATEEAHAVAKIASFKETRAMWGQRASGEPLPMPLTAGPCEQRGKMGQTQQSAQEAEVALQRLLVCNDHDELRRMRRLINASFTKEGAD